jgi:hypothetical protein
MKTITIAMDRDVATWRSCMRDTSITCTMGISTTLMRIT